MRSGGGRSHSRFSTEVRLETPPPAGAEVAPHTARGQLLLETFPGAKFIHIHRDPHAVFRPNRPKFRVASELYRCQHTRLDDHDDWILRQYRTLYDTFFEVCGLIPAGHYHEGGIEELEKNPVG